MKLSTATLALAALSSSFVSAISLFGGSTTRQVEATAAFPASNAFSRVVNGQDNEIAITIQNKEDVEIDVNKIFGAFKDANTEKFIRNTTTAVFQSKIPAKGKNVLKYSFYSEFKPQDTRLQIWVEYAVGGQPFVTQAFDSVVSIVEPPASIFDFQLILTYLMILGIFGTTGYVLYESFYPKPKAKKNKIPTPSAPIEVTATSKSGYQEEWIPEHHLKSRSASGKKARSPGALSSGDESGPEKKGKKRN